MQKFLRKKKQFPFFAPHAPLSLVLELETQIPVMVKVATYSVVKIIL